MNGSFNPWSMKNMEIHELHGVTLIATIYMDPMAQEIGTSACTKLFQGLKCFSLPKRIKNVKFLDFGPKL